MTKLWFNPWTRNLSVHLFLVLIASFVPFSAQFALSNQIKACTAVESPVGKVENKAITEKCNSLFKNLDKDLDPWIYVLLGFSTYLQAYGWASGNVSVHTAMETKPDEDTFFIQKPYFIDEELFKFGYHFAKVLKSQSQLVKKPELIFYDEFFDFKFTGFVKRDLVISALLASYPLLEVKTQDSLRSVLRDITTNANDKFDVSEIAIQFLIVSRLLGFEPSMKLLKKIALLQSLNSLNSPEIDSLDKLLLPQSFNGSNFGNSNWLAVFSNWTKVAEIAKTSDEVKKIYDPSNPIVITDLDSAQNLFNSLFVK